MKSLVDRCLLVEGECSINLSRHLPGDNLQDLTAKLDEKTVERSVNLGVNVLAVLLAVAVNMSESVYRRGLGGVYVTWGGGEKGGFLRNGSIDERGIFGLLGCSEDEGRVGGGVLGLVLCDGSKVTAGKRIS